MAQHLLFYIHDAKHARVASTGLCSGAIKNTCEKDEEMETTKVASSMISRLRRGFLYVLYVAMVILPFAKASFAQVPQFGHVFLVVEENHGYTKAIGNPVMPYLNSLSRQYGLAINYYANTHPSIGNYFVLTTGEVITNNDNYKSTVDIDNIVRALTKAGLTWKSYAESLPEVGYIGNDVFPYVKHHNPFAYFSDVTKNPTQRNNLVPFSQFATDLAAGTLPQYSFIVPNNQNNAHSCPADMITCTDAAKLATADLWLQTNIDPLVQSPTFQTDGLLIIVFDEAGASDTNNGGGHVAAVVVSPKVQAAGYKGKALYQHQSVLKLMASGLGLKNFPGSSASAPDMAEFFGSPTWSCPVISNNVPAVSICTPTDGDTLTSPARVFAVAVMDNPVTSMQVQVDGVPAFDVSANRVDTQISLPVGSHLLTVQAIDSTNLTVSSSATLNIVKK